ncbi:MAG: hypothetical protein ACLSG5_02020 [Oscillospiraceae bacterium]
MTAGLRKTAALLALAVMFTGCSAPAESESGAALPDVVGSMDIRYAEQFSVDYLADGSALAEVADGRRYLIIPDGGEVPEHLPEDVTVISSRRISTLLRPPRWTFSAALTALAIFLQAPRRKAAGSSLR